MSDTDSIYDNFSDKTKTAVKEYTNEVIGAVLIELSNRGIDISETLTADLFKDAYKRLRLPW